jgi:D-tyrosyl-tRNA(Tyr) deacylase
MRVLLQRVSRATVSIDEEAISSIGIGYVLLVGVGRGEETSQVERLADKIVGLRIFRDAGGKTNLPIADVDGEALVVSQFTLYADTRKGRRPSFVDAAPPDEARRLYGKACDALRALGIRVEEGVFAADMQVALVNDGPVTISLEQPPAPRQ